MPGLSVRQKYVYQQHVDEKHTGMGNQIAGLPLFVYPGAAATHFSFIKDRHARAYATVAEALADAVAGRGDAIVLMPGTHTVSTASLAMSKSDVAIYGHEAWCGYSYPGRASRSILTTDIAGDEIMNVTAAGCSIVGVTITPITASDAIDLSAAANYFTLKNCYFDLFTPAVNVATIGITLAAATGIVIDGCTALSDGAQGPAIVATGALDSYILNSRFANTLGTWAAAVLVGAATRGLEIGACVFDSTGTAMTAGVDGTGATIARGCIVRYCDFGNLVTVPVDNFDANEAQLVECYKAGVGAMDGGTKITAIT